MSGERNYSPYIIIGKLTRDFILTREGEAVNNIPGGHLLYTAIGMSPWEKHPGLVARVGKNYPQEFLTLLKKYEFSLHGIRRLDTDIDQRSFISFFSDNGVDTHEKQSVLSQYFHAGKPFPKELLGYKEHKKSQDNINEKTQETILARDIPPEYQEARCVHLCPMDYLSHNLLPQAFPGENKRTITVHASGVYMQPPFFDAVKTLVNGLNAFFVREKYLSNLFYEKYRITGINEMMKVLLDYGAENIVVKMTDNSYRFINRSDRIVMSLDPCQDEKSGKMGALSAFCGAYLIGLNTTYDYRKAAAYGAARASLLRDEWKPYHNLNVLESLLLEKVRIMENRINDII